MNTVLILGSNSDVGKELAYVFAKNNFDVILATRTVSDTQKEIAEELTAKYDVETLLVSFDGVVYKSHAHLYEDLVIKPTVVVSVFGYLGEQNVALSNFKEAHKIMTTNYVGQVSVFNHFAEIFKEKRKGTLIGVSSVAGERGRQSNFIYGSAKSGFSTYLSGLRNYLHKYDVHVITVKPGFINTKMIKHLKTNKVLTAQPNKVAEAIWKAYERKKNTIYVLPVWRYIMFVIKNIPETIFKKLKL